MGIETSKTVKEACGDFFEILEYVYLAIFILEAVMKLLAYSYHYFFDGWNDFDLIIIIVSLIPSSANISSLRTLRMFRAFRAFKIAERFSNLKIIICSILHSGASICWVGLMIVIFFYVFAIVGYYFFGHAFPDKFGTLAKSLYSLFVVITFEGLASQYARPIGEVYPWSQLYFVIFAVIVNYLLMNIIVGIICSALQTVTLEEREEEKQIKLVEEVQNLHFSDLKPHIFDELNCMRLTLSALKSSHLAIINSP